MTADTRSLAGRSNRKNYRNIFRVLMLSRIDRNVEFARPGAPVAHNKALHRGHSRLWPCSLLKRRTHTRATHEQALSHTHKHAHTDHDADTRRGTVRFEHFRVVRLMNRLLFLQTLLPSTSWPLFPFARVRLVIATNDRSRASPNQPHTRIFITRIDPPDKLHERYPHPFSTMLSLNLRFFVMIQG